MRAHWHSYSRMTLLGPSKQNNNSSFTVLSMEKYIFQDLNHCLILEDKVQLLWVHAQKCCLFSIFTMLYGTHLTSSFHDTQLDRMPTTTTLQHTKHKSSNMLFQSCCIFTCCSKQKEKILQYKHYLIPSPSWWFCDHFLGLPLWPHTPHFGLG